MRVLYLARSPRGWHALHHVLSNDDRPTLPMTGAPLYERLAEHYRRVIAAGTLAPGERMPSMRAFMSQHRVSLSTAIQTYRQLERAGFLLAKPRSGYFIRRPVHSTLPNVHEPEIEAVPLPAQFVGLHQRISGVVARAHRFPDALNLGGATAAAALYPAEQLKSLAIRTLRHKPTLLTESGPMEGAEPFRHAIARRLLSCGVSVSQDDIIATNGGVEAVNLALRAVAQPGDAIAIESPAFFGLLQILESLGLRALEIPTSPTTGLSLEALDIALTAYDTVKAVVVVSTLQNPLGCIMPDDRKAGLVALCARHGVAVIEDDPYRELVGHEVATKPVKAWDRAGGVIYCSSLNKVLAPGMRLGWVSAGRWHERVKMLKFAQSRHNEALPQLVAAQFIDSGAFDRHLHQLRDRLGAQREAMSRAIAHYFPAGTHMTRPTGGLLLWVGLPDHTHSETLFDAALQEGIRIAPGSIFSNSSGFDSFMRVSCPSPFDDPMEAAIRRLGQLAGGLSL